MTIEKHNPYTSPTADVALRSTEKGSAVKAVLVGLAVDIGGSLLFGVVFAIAYGIYLGSSGASAEHIASSLSDAPADSWFFLVGTGVGCAFSVLGAYLCARIARHAEYTLGGIMATISVVFAFFISAEHYAPAVNILLASATIASIMLGAWLGALKNKRER